MRISEAIYKLNPQVVRTDCEVAYDADGKEVKYNKVAVKALVASEAYKELRAKEYPSIADQLDYIYHNGVDALKEEMIDPVKNKYPKG